MAMEERDLTPFGYPDYYINKGCCIYTKATDTLVPIDARGMVALRINGGPGIRVSIDLLFRHAFDPDYFLDPKLPTHQLIDEDFSHYRIASNGYVYDEKGLKTSISGDSVYLKKKPIGWKNLSIKRLRKKYLSTGISNLLHYELKNLKFIGRPDCWATLDGRVWDISTYKWIKKASLRCEYDGKKSINLKFLNKLCFFNYYDQAKDEDKIVMSDIPKLWDHECEYYKQFIKKRRYDLFTKYAIIANKGIWSFVYCNFVNPCVNRNGYANMTFHDDNKKQWNKTIHVVVSDAFLTHNPDCLIQVNHMDGDKTNFNIKDDSQRQIKCNLERCIPSQNRLHGIKTGLIKFKKGEASHSSKISLAEAESIRTLKAKHNYPTTELSDMFKISRRQINRILNNEVWSA